MTSWAYRTTTKGTDLEKTVDLLTQHSFLWRPVFKKTSNRTKAGFPPINSLLRDIVPNQDNLFVYYSRARTVKYIGGFSFSQRHPGAHDDAPAMVKIPAGDHLEVLLDNCGYERDPFLGVYTGFDLVPLRDGSVPPGSPRFSGQYAIGRFDMSSSDILPLQETVTACEVAPGSFAAQTGPSTTSGRCWGLDWSGALRAGEKVWRAELDPANREIVRVERPWLSSRAETVIRDVADWLATVGDAWVAFDFPFGIAESDRATLLGATSPEPRAWGLELQRRFPRVDDLIAAVTLRGLLGRNRRVTDGASPFAPLLLQLIRQTYWGQRLLALMPADSMAILPWDHESTARIRILETCPAVLLRFLGQTNVGYKLKPGSDVRRGQLLTAVLAATSWNCSPAIGQTVIEDDEGDALDAILAGLSAWRGSAVNHSEIATVCNLGEGYIYV